MLCGDVPREGSSRRSVSLEAPCHVKFYVRPRGQGAAELLERDRGLSRCAFPPGQPRAACGLRIAHGLRRLARGRRAAARERAERSLTFANQVRHCPLMPFDALGTAASNGGSSLPSLSPERTAKPEARLGMVLPARTHHLINKARPHRPHPQTGGECGRAASSDAGPARRPRRERYVGARGVGLSQRERRRAHEELRGEVEEVRRWAGACFWRGSGAGLARIQRSSD